MLTGASSCGISNPTKTLRRLCGFFRADLLALQRRRRFQAQPDTAYARYVRRHPRRFLRLQCHALEIRKALVEHWDGEDFPHFVKYLFGRFPSPQTFYHLWSGLTPTIWNGMPSSAPGKENWLGGEARKISKPIGRPIGSCPTNTCTAISWLAQRSSSSVFRPSPMPSFGLAMPSSLCCRIGTIRWISANRIYQRWIAQLSALNPDLQLYGSDYCNSNVNCIRAETYWERYQRSGGSYLQPSKLGRYQIRM